MAALACVRSISHDDDRNLHVCEDRTITKIGPTCKAFAINMSVVFVELLRVASCSGSEDDGRG